MTPGGGAPEARGIWGEGCAPGPSSQAGGGGGSLTERTLMRIGVSNRHAILSLPTRLQRTPARGPALSTAKCRANHRYLGGTRQVGENGPRSRHAGRTARARRRKDKGVPHRGPPYESSAGKRQLLSAWVRGGSGRQSAHAHRAAAGPTCRARGAEPRGRGLAAPPLASRTDWSE